MIESFLTDTHLPTPRGTESESANLSELQVSLLISTSLIDYQENCP